MTKLFAYLFSSSSVWTPNEILKTSPVCLPFQRERLVSHSNCSANDRVIPVSLMTLLPSMAVPKKACGFSVDDQFCRILPRIFQWLSLDILEIYPGKLTLRLTWWWKKHEVYDFHIWDVIRNPLTHIFQDGKIAPPTRYINVGYPVYIIILYIRDYIGIILMVTSHM